MTRARAKQDGIAGRANANFPFPRNQLHEFKGDLGC